MWYPRHWASFVVIILLLVIAMVVLTGCTHSIDRFKCKCDCEGKSRLECSSNETNTEIEGY